MRVITSLVVVVVILAFANPGRAAAPAAAPASTFADAQADFDAKQYKSALQKISKALSTTNPKAAPEARYDLFVLRGECLLRMNERTLAIDAFRSAARTMKDDGDVHKAATAAGTALLVEASRNLKYKSTGPPAAEPIDVVEPEGRKQALSALFEERFAATEPKANKAIESKTLPPLLDLLPQMRDLYVIEVAAKGDAPQTIPLLKTLGGRGRELITDELARVNRRLDDIQDALTQEVYLGLRNIQGVRERGLSSAEQKELQQTYDYLGKIAKVAQQGRWIARRLGEGGEGWETILADCSETRDAVESLAARK
jgi:tetratricopeptide (TPR) repeat protein